MSLNWFWKTEIVIDKKKFISWQDLDLHTSQTDWNSQMEKELEKVTYLFEVLMEKDKWDTNSLNELNVIKLAYALILKKRKEMKIFFEKNKVIIEEYENINSKFFENKEKELKEYYDSIDKEKLLFYIEYERTSREYRELEIYYEDLVKKFKSWTQRIEKLKDLLQSVETELSIDYQIENQWTWLDAGSVIKTLPFDEYVSMQYLFDQMRISWKNNGIQMFSSLNKSIFSLFDAIEWEELLDPLINVICSISPEITEDNFISVFKDFVQGKISAEIDIFWLESWEGRNYLLFRDFLMWFKTSVFFRKESYLYLFEIDGNVYYVKYKSDVWLMSQWKIEQFKSETDVEEFFNNYLKLSS